MKKLIVFLRHNNDIDHITPILHKWLSTRDIETQIIITSDESLYYDYRIKFLRYHKNLKVNHINDFFRGSFWKWFNNFYSKNPSIEKHPFAKKWIERNARHLFKKLVNTDSVVCFDWNYNHFVMTFVTLCQIYDIPTIALPHGDEPYVNKMQKDGDTTYVLSILPYAQRSIFDYILVPNKLCAIHYECISKDFMSKVKILGSPRYCKEWIPIHDSIRKGTLEDFKAKFLVQGSQPPLKVVLFLRNNHWPLNWRELMVLIKMIKQFKTILVIKAHARGSVIDPLDLSQYDATFIDYENSLNPSYLIDWADLVLDVGTSTTWEAIIKNKPILMLDYICGNKPTISHYMYKTSIACRDDLYENLRKFSKNPKRQVYTPEQRKKFMKDIIGTGDTLENYCKFLEAQFD